MAKAAKKAPANPKKHSSKYSKLAIVASKELVEKKAALVRAEKVFAKAQKTHQELLGEVARLDMLDRSLKALLNGTEPPQNVRYVYTYPNWVWQQPGYGYWYNNGAYSITLGSTPTFTTSGNLQSGSQLCNLTTTGYNANTIGAITTTGSNFVNAVNSSITTPSSLSSSYTLNSGYADNSNSYTAPADSVLTSTSGTSQWITATGSDLTDLTVDLSTGQADPDTVPVGVEVEEEVGVGHGG